MELFLSNGSEANIYPVCEWLIDRYPDDIFKDNKNTPVNKLRELAKEILAVRNGGEE